VIPAWTHRCCARCRLRFTPAVATYLIACPECGDPPQPISTLELTFGFRLIGPEDLPHELPYATARSIALPEPGARRGKEVE
jgi:hypothetical protein